ncbi:MAG: DJ-1/PfpI family protein [Myxococcota bacterium]
MIRVAILLFEDVDLLDVGGPYEVFLTADRIAQRRGEAPQFEVITVSADGQPVTSFGGLGLVPTAAANTVEKITVAVIPGAIDIEAVCARPEVVAAVEHLVAVASVKSSVCTGAFLLGDRNLLADIPWTTHFEDVPGLAQRLSSDDGQAHVGWVDAGEVVTAGGLSSGLAMALHLVERLHSRELAETTAKQLEYAWNPDGGVRA